MSGLRVSSTELLDVRGRLDQLGQELLSLHVEIWDGSGQLGGRALAGELEHFCGTWHGASTRLADQIAGLGVRLGEAAQAYRQIEQRLADEGQRQRHRAPGGRSGSGTTIIGGGGGSGSGPGSGSGTTIIGGGPPPPPHPHRAAGGAGGTGSGTTIIGGGPPPPAPHPHRPAGGTGRGSGGGSGSGSGTTVIG